MKRKILIFFFCCCLGLSLRMVWLEKDNINLYVTLHNRDILEQKIHNTEISYIYFFKKGCPACNASKKILNDYIKTDKVEIYAIDVEDDNFNYYDLLENYNLSKTPTLIIYKNSKEIARFEGAITKERIYKLKKGVFYNE